MLALLVVCFVAVPLAELAVILWVGEHLGVLDTIGLLILCSVIGAVVVRRQGLGVWRRARAQLDAGRLPAAELLDGVLVLAAGALLLTPGFLTDGLGFLLLTPPARHAARALTLRRLWVRVIRIVPPAGAPTVGRSLVRPADDIVDG